MSILRIAHRGASGYELENSFKAFDKALALGVDMLECDAQLTQDRQLVIMHDKFIDRTTWGRGKVSSMTWNDLQSVKLENGQLIPTLDQILEKYKDKTKIMIDVKNIQAAIPLVNLIKQHQAHDKVIIASALHPLLSEIKLRDSKINVSILFNIYNYLKYFFVKNSFVLSAKLMRASAVNIYYKFVDQQMIDRAHKNNLKINVFPPSEKKVIEKFIKMGVDGIITNYPDRIII